MQGGTHLARRDVRMERLLTRYRAEALGAYASGGSQIVFETCEKVLESVGSAGNQIKNARSALSGEMQGNLNDEIDAVVSELWDGICPDRTKAIRQKAKENLVQKARRAADERQGAYLDEMYSRMALQGLREQIGTIESSMRTVANREEERRAREQAWQNWQTTVTRQTWRTTLTQSSEVAFDPDAPDLGGTAHQIEDELAPSPVLAPLSFEERLAELRQETEALRQAELRKARGWDFPDLPRSDSVIVHSNFYPF